MTETTDADTLQRIDPVQMHCDLIAPFAEFYVKWIPQSVYKEQALAACYIDARTVMDRLDEVFGADGWKDEYQPAPGGGLNCRLWAYWPLKDEWTFHEGFGAPGGGSGIDADKSAESDSLKRAAVKYGIGRYLYRIPTQWIDCELKANGKFKRFKREPELPKWAIPQSGDCDGRPPYQEEVKETKTSPATQPAQQGENIKPLDNPGEYVIQLKGKHEGETISQVNKDAPTYLTNFILGNDFKARTDSTKELVANVQAFFDGPTSPTPGTEQDGQTETEPTGWPVGVVAAIVAKKFADNAYNAIGMLNLSKILTPDMPQARMTAWASAYRAQRDNDQPSNEAAAIADRLFSK